MQLALATLADCALPLPRPMAAPGLAPEQTNGKVRSGAVAVLALDVATLARCLDARAAAAALRTMRARLLCLRASGAVRFGEAGTLHESSPSDIADSHSTLQYSGFCTTRVAGLRRPQPIDWARLISRPGIAPARSRITCDVHRHSCDGRYQRSVATWPSVAPWPVR